MNSFLSTSRNRELTLFPFKDVERSDDLQQILFEIDAEIHSNGYKPFANISALSYFPNEDEILFMIGSIFRLTSIRLENRVWLVGMTLCSDDDHDLKQLSEHMKREYGIGELSFIKFGHVLADMGKLDQADQYYRRLLNELPSNSSTDVDIAHLYGSLGIVASDKGDYNRSLDWHKKSLDIMMRADRFNYTEICNTLSNIGETHRLNGDLEMALESHNKALTLFKEAHGENHPRMAGFICNIGIVYQYQSKHAEALEFYEKALAIQQKYLPPNHPQLAIYYNNIGIFHHILKHYDLALEYLNMALKIRLKSLSPQHPSIASSYRSIALAHDHKNELEQALTYYQKAVTIYRNILPVHHPDIIEIEEHIQRVSAKLE
jgi:tetratricopeptide (TPR) repeat protein